MQTQAAAIQPVEAKVSKLAILKLQYPTILSSTIAGTIEAVGESVTALKVGDRVASSTNLYPNKGDPKYGGQQRFTISEARETIEVGRTPFSHVSCPPFVSS